MSSHPFYRPSKRREESSNISRNILVPAPIGSTSRSYIRPYTTRSHFSQIHPSYNQQPIAHAQSFRQCKQLIKYSGRNLEVVQYPSLMQTSPATSIIYPQAPPGFFVSSYVPNNNNSTMNVHLEELKENIPHVVRVRSEPEVCYDDESIDEKEDTNQRTYDQMWPPLPKTKENIQSDEEQYFSNRSLNCTSSFTDVANTSTSSNESSKGVLLNVSNLDATLSYTDLKNMLYELFSSHVQIHYLSIYTRSNTPLGLVKVGSKQDAQYLISQVHKKKVGFRRIEISYAYTERSTPNMLRMQMVSLLEEVPHHSMPLHVFLKIFLKRFQISISYSDLLHFLDVIMISNDSPAGRIVVLNPSYRQSPLYKEEDAASNASAQLSNSGEPCQTLLWPICQRHAVKVSHSKGWAEMDLAPPLANVRVPLQVFANRLVSLLRSHNGILPLNSLPQCYAAEFEPLDEDTEGVPLEYLVTCVPQVRIRQGPIGLRAKQIENVKSEDVTNCVSPQLENKLSSFCQQVYDIFRELPRGQLLFTHFIPHYHRSFGYQCRIADYGFTKLSELLDAIPDIVQVIGEGDHRLVILSFEAQIKRFVQHIHRILKTHPGNLVSVSQLPETYKRVFKRPFETAEYGVCTIQDILNNINDNSITIDEEVNGEIIISMSRKEQSILQVEKIQEFGRQVLELLRYTPDYEIIFSEFIPRYHAQFGMQCRVLDYGVPKLINLFNYISDIVEISDENNNRIIRLRLKHRLPILADQLTSLAKGTFLGQILLKDLPKEYLNKYGYPLRAETYNVRTIEEAVKLVSDRIGLSEDGSAIIPLSWTPVDNFQIKFLRTFWDFLPEKPTVSIHDFIFAFWYRWRELCTQSDIEKSFSHLVNLKIKNDVTHIELKSLQIFAWEVHEILLMESEFLPLKAFPENYLKRFGRLCDPVVYGFHDLSTLLMAIPETIQLRGKGRLTIIKLNPLFKAVETGLEELIKEEQTQKTIPIKNGFFSEDELLCSQSINSPEEALTANLISPRTPETFISPRILQMIDTVLESPILQIPTPKISTPVREYYKTLPRLPSSEFLPTPPCLSRKKLFEDKY